MAEETKPSFAIEKLYVKDVSLEIPNAPKIFLERETPKIEVQLNTGGGTFDKNLYEALLTVTVTAKINDKTMFLVEVRQAGIFRIEGVSEKDAQTVLAVTCQNILFPYAREAVSDVIVRAGFPPVLLSPVNFEALYQHQQQQAQQKKSAPEDAKAKS
jgi:preprotein translocase subunit SecB